MAFWGNAGASAKGQRNHLCVSPIAGRVNLSPMTAADTIPDDLPDPHTTAGKIADLERRRYEAVHAGSAAGIEKQHERGKLTARERIDLLMDEGSFLEFAEPPRARAHDFAIRP